MPSAGGQSGADHEPGAHRRYHVDDPGATMTLPGIAGIVLTLGMAVDANVLILRAYS